MEENHLLAQRLVIAISFLVALILEIIPLPHWAVWGRPEWVFLVLVFWVVLQPHSVGLCIAFFVGILMDLMTGTLLGQHAFAFSLAIYLVIAFHPQLKSFPLWQQLSIICTLTLLQLALQCWILEIVGLLPQNWAYWLPAFTSTLVWPWFYVLLRDRQEMIRIR